MTSAYWILLSVSLVGVGILAFGLRGLMTGRPLLFSSRWIFVALVVFVAPLFAQSPGLGLPPELEGDIRFQSVLRVNWLLYLLPRLMFLFVLVMMWFQTRGYSAQGVTPASFRQGLLGALAKMNLPYEESLSLIHLPTLDADLRVTAGWGGGYIAVKERKHAALLRQIAGETNDFYRSTSVETNRLSWVSYVVLGALLCVSSVTWLIVR